MTCMCTPTASRGLVAFNFTGAARTNRGYRVTRMKAHPGDNSLTFENIITGGAFIGGCGI